MIPHWATRDINVNQHLDQRFEVFHMLLFDHLGEKTTDFFSLRDLRVNTCLLQSLVYGWMASDSREHPPLGRPDQGRIH